MPVDVTVSYDDGTIYRDVWSDGMRVELGKPKTRIKSVIVSHEGRKLFVLNQREIDRMEKSVSNDRKITWNIEVDGIKPLDAKELEDLLKERKR